MYYNFSTDKIGYKKMLCDIENNEYNKTYNIPVRIPSKELLEVFIEYILTNENCNKIYIHISKPYEKIFNKKIIKILDNIKNKDIKINFLYYTDYNFIMTENHLIVLTPNNREIATGMFISKNEFNKMLIKFNYLKSFFNKK